MSVPFLADSSQKPSRVKRIPTLAGRLVTRRNGRDNTFRRITTRTTSRSFACGQYKTWPCSKSSGFILGSHLSIHDASGKSRGLARSAPLSPYVPTRRFLDSDFCRWRHESSQFAYSADSARLFRRKAPTYRHFGKCLSVQWVARQQSQPLFHPVMLAYHSVL